MEWLGSICFKKNTVTFVLIQFRCCKRQIHKNKQVLISFLKKTLTKIEIHCKVLSIYGKILTRSNPPPPHAQNFLGKKSERPGKMDVRVLGGRPVVGLLLPSNCLL